MEKLTAEVEAAAAAAALRAGELAALESGMRALREAGVASRPGSGSEGMRSRRETTEQASLVNCLLITSADCL